MRGPVWTQYSNAAGPGGKGAGLLSSMEGNLGETRIRLAEKVTAEGKEYESVAKSVVQQETRINAELQEREAIYKRLQQGAALTSRPQAAARTSLVPTLPVGVSILNFKSSKNSICFLILF